MSKLPPFKVIFSQLILIITSTNNFKFHFYDDININLKPEKRARINKTILNKIEFLKNKVDSLEKTAKYSNQPTQSYGISENNQLAASIHGQVTSLSLEKVSQELESFGSQLLASNDTVNKFSTQIQPTTTSIEKQQIA